MTHQAFKLDINDGIAHVVLNRPDRLNAMDGDFWTEIREIFDGLNDNPDVRVSVISSTGKHFSAGMDLNFFSTIAPPSGGDPGRQRDQVRRLVLHLQESFNGIERCRVPVLAWGLGLYLPYRLYGGVGEMFRQIAAARPELLVAPGLASTGEIWTWGEYSAAVLVSIFGFSVWPHLFMKAFTAKDDTTIRRTVVLFPTFQLFLIPVFIIGFAGVLFPEAPPESDFILPFMILRSELPALVVGLFCAGALSASMSTGDALLHAGASVAVEDGVGKFKALTDRQQRLLMRGLVVGMGAVAYFFALYEGVSLVVLLLSSYGIIAQFTPPLVAALYWKRATTPAVTAGLVAGSAVTLFFFFNGHLRPWDLHEGILGLLVHLPVLIGVTYLTRDPDPRSAEAFLAAARDGGDTRSLSR